MIKSFTHLYQILTKIALAAQVPELKMPHRQSLEFAPIPNAPLGAVVTLPAGVTDPSKLDEQDFKTLKEALFMYGVLVIPGQEDLPPSSQYELTK